MEAHGRNNLMTNYVRLCYVAQHENRNLLEALLCRLIQPTKEFMNPEDPKLTPFLKRTDAVLLRECLRIKHFEKLHLRLIYVLIRNFEIIEPPSTGWNEEHNYTSKVLTIGDGVKLIYKMYNLILHSGQTTYTNEEVRELFLTFENIARIFDDYLNRSGEIVSRYQNLRECCVDADINFIYSSHLRVLHNGLNKEDGERFQTIGITDPCQLSAEVTNYMRVIYAIQVVLAEEFRKYISSRVTPEELQKKYSDVSFNRTLPVDVKNIIDQVPQQGYTNFSLYSIRKIIMNKYTNIDTCNIDAILRDRDKITFRANATMTLEEMTYSFALMTQTAMALELHMQLPVGNLCTKLKYYETCCMDKQPPKWYHEGLIYLADKETQFGTSKNYPNPERTSRFWYLPHVTEKQSLDTRRYVLIGNAFEETLSLILQEFLSHIVPCGILFTTVFIINRYQAFNARDYLLFLESKTNGYKYFDTMLLSSVLTELCKIDVHTFEKIYKTNGYKDFDTMRLSSVLTELCKIDVHTFEKIYEIKCELLNKERKELTDNEMVCYLSFFKEVARVVENSLLCLEGTYVSKFEKTQTLIAEEEQLKQLFASLEENAHKEKKPTRMGGRSFEKTPLMLDSKEFYGLLVHGSYISYENRLYFGGPCNAGKTSLACILTGDEVPDKWVSTNGLQIYFGQNGIHLKDKKMIAIRKGMLCHTVHGKVISAINEMHNKDATPNPNVIKVEKKETVATDHNVQKSFSKRKLEDDCEEEEKLPLQKVSDKRFDNDERQKLDHTTKLTESKSDIKHKFDKIPTIKDNEIEGSDNSAANKPKISSKEEEKDTQIKIVEKDNPSSQISQSSSSSNTLNMLQEETLRKSILDEIRNGKYNLEIAPSDVVDFGGQKAFDMTHQLFILQEGTVLLLFDGSKDLNEPLPEYPGQIISSADILLHWVDSVSTYCTEESGMHRIQFVATHSDRYQDNFEIRRKELVTQLAATFHNHEKKLDLCFDNLFFIDARNKDDNEIDKLKDKLVQVAFSQKSWGKKMPLLWVPLEKQIVDLKLRGTSILRIEEIQKLNKSNEDLMMDDEQLNYFLRTQHAIGKLVYFDQDDELAKFVIIEPSVLVNALRSFVTDEMFFPKNDTECYHILKKLQLEGMLKKNDLLKLWNQDEFKSIFQEQDYKDFIVKILLRVDVLVEPTLLNHDVNISPDYYIVPCMIQTRLDNDYAAKYLNRNRSICMAYVFKVQMVPPCVFFRLIASAVGIWPFKEYQERKMFFQDIATFVFDENNEFSLIMDGRKIVVYFTNANSIQKIQQPKVASVQECLSMAIKSITEFYQIHSGSSHAFDVKMFEKPFELEYGAACKAPCFFKREEELRLSKVGMWKCKHGESHEADYLWYWDSKKSQTKTPKKMNDISPIALMEKPPADLLRKLSFAVGIDGARLGLNLGVKSSVIENMVISNRYNIFEKTLKILDHWKMFGDSVTVKHLVEGLQTIGGRGLETIVEYYRYQNTADLPHVRTTASDLQSLSFKSPLMRCRSNSLPSLRSPLANNKEGKDWFYKLKIYCDMYDLHLIIDRTLETQYKSLAETVNQKDILTSLIEKKKCSKSFMSVFEKIYQLTICSISTSSEEICEQNELLFRFILARNLCPFKVSNLLRQAMEDQMHKLCKAFSWYLLRSMIKETSISDFFSQVKDIWPGFFCKCSQRKKGHSAICSKEPVIVIDADEYLEGLPGEIYGIPVKQSAYYLATENTQESDISIEQNYSCEDMTTVSGENAKELFLPHTKLTLIYKSLTQPWCVILCCQAKGIIPMGEKHLPAVVCSMNTKVMHGNVSFLHKMKVGSKVGPAGAWGTLGGFVQRRGRDAFLTCAHVVYDRKLLLCGNKRNKNKEEVIVNCYVNGDANAFICGSVIDDKFIYDKCDKTSIDAAVVILDRNTSSIDNDEIVQVIDPDGNQSTHPAAFLGMTSAYLNDNYISNKIEKGEMKARLVGANSGYFEGNVKYEDYDADKQTFEDGLEHGVVVQWANLADQLEKVKESNVEPLHVITDVHFQRALLSKLDKMAKHDRHFVRFYNQLLIENFKFQAGDSGTCIYIVEDKSFTRTDNEPNPKGCIGMAIAGYTDVRDGNIKTVVTPMKAILEAFDLI